MTPTHPEVDIVERLEAASAKMARVREATASVIFGQERVIDLTLITLLAGGHALLIGVPGLAKTSLVETLGRVLGLDNKRIQFTPDLMPSDIVGSEVLEETANGARSFRFIKGPMFTQLLMADEINRASPKTQSRAAAGDAGASCDGRRVAPRRARALPRAGDAEPAGAGRHLSAARSAARPFPAADRCQLSRRAAERRMLFATTGTEERRRSPCSPAQELIAAQRLVRQLPVGDQVVDAILGWCAPRGRAPAMPGTRRYVAWGPGPRASQALMLAVRARALLDGRLAPSVDDVDRAGRPVLKHRMALTFAARAEGVPITDIVASLTKQLG